VKNLCIPFLRKFLGDQHGQSMVVIVVCLFALMALSAAGVETGHVYYAYRLLQSSTNAATLAGAQVMPNINAATTNVTKYSSKTGDENATNLLQNVSIATNFYCSTNAKNLNVQCQAPPAGEGSCTTGSTCNAKKIIKE